MLELAILGLLKERPMHGYDLRKRLREDFGLLANLSFGSLYPALARLEAAGAVRSLAAAASEVAQVPLPSIPPTGSLSGERAIYRARHSLAAIGSLGSDRTSRGERGPRGRKVYEITPQGEREFERLLEDESRQPEDTRTFSLRLVFARHLSPDARLRLLERRRAQLLDRLTRTRRSMSAGRRPLDPYERSLVEHSSETTELDISWLDRLIEAERNGPLGTTAYSSGAPGAQHYSSTTQAMAVAAAASTAAAAPGTDPHNGRNDR